MDGNAEIEKSGEAGAGTGEQPAVFGLTLRTRQVVAGRYEARVVEAWSARGESQDPEIARRRALCALWDLIAERVLQDPPGVERYPELESDRPLVVTVAPGGDASDVDVFYGWASITSALAPPGRGARDRLSEEWAALRSRASGRRARAS